MSILAGYYRCKFENALNKTQKCLKKDNFRTKTHYSSNIAKIAEQGLDDLFMRDLYLFGFSFFENCSKKN